MFKTIVLAVDGSESSDRAVEHATMLARDQGSTVRVVHVIEIAVGRGGGPVHLDEAALKAKFEQQTRELVEAGVDAELELHSAIAGGPAHVIAEVARRSNADLIITGSRGHTAVAGILLGSVTHRLLHVSHCPLLVIPSAEVAHLVGETVTEAEVEAEAVTVSGAAIALA
jgi:nucleotide-binding universal stress UspA family protein